MHNIATISAQNGLERSDTHIELKFDEYRGTQFILVVNQLHRPIYIHLIPIGNVAGEAGLVPRDRRTILHKHLHGAYIGIDQIIVRQGERVDCIEGHIYILNDNIRSTRDRDHEIVVGTTSPSTVFTITARPSPPTSERAFTMFEKILALFLAVLCVYIFVSSVYNRII